MRILFINTHFPGTFGPLLSFLAASGEHECFFASGYRRQNYAVPGVRHIRLGGTQPRARSLAQEMEGMYAAGSQALRAFEQLNAGGFEPDMVLTTLFGSYALFWEKAFPASFRVCWAESAKSLLHPGPPANALGMVRQGLLCRQALGCHLLVSLSAGQPEEAVAGMLKQGADLPYPVNDEWFAPHTVESLAFDNVDLAHAGEVVVVFAGRGLGQSPGLEQVLRGLLATRKDCHVVLLGEGRTGQGEIASGLALLVAEYPARVLALGTLSLARYRDLLALATLLLVPGNDSLPSSVLLEAMSSAVPLVLAPGAVTAPCLLPGTNCLCLPGLESCEDAPSLVAGLADFLERADVRARMGKEARATIVRDFSQKRLLPAHARFLLDACAAWRAKQVKG